VSDPFSMTDIVFHLIDGSLSAVQGDEAIHDLRLELLDLDLVSVVPPGLPAPPGARGGELAEYTALAVQIVMDSGLAQALAERVIQWFGRHDPGEVRVSIGNASLIVTSPTAEQQERLVSHFIKATGG